MRPLNASELERLKELVRSIGWGRGASQDDIMMAIAEAVQLFNSKADRAAYGRATEPLLREAAREMGLVEAAAAPAGTPEAPGVVPAPPGAPPTVVVPAPGQPQTVTLPGQPARPIIILPPGGTPGGKPVGELSDAEIAAALLKKKEPPSPIGGPGPEVYARAAVQNALQALGVSLPDDLLPTFTNELQRRFAEIAVKPGAPYTAQQFPQFLDDITRMPLPPTMAPGGTLLGGETFGAAGEEPSASILDYLDDWQAQLDAEARAKVEAARLTEEAKATAALKALQQKEAADRQTQIQDAQFNEAFNQLKYRYPASASVLDVMKGTLKAGYDEFVHWNTQATWLAEAGLPTDTRLDISIVDPATGLLMPGLPSSQLTPGAWLAGVDMDDFMKRQGPEVYGAWQTTQVQGAFDANIAAPLRAGAKTAADKIRVEEQIGAMASMTPLLLDTYKRAKAANPALDPITFMEGREARELMGTAVMETQRQQARVMEQKREVASAMAERGYDVQFIASRLQVSVDQAQQMAQAALNLRQSQVTAATLSLGGMAMLPAGEVRTGEFGEISVPQTVRQYVQTPTTAQQLQERDAALNALTGGRFGALSYQSLVAQANQFNIEAQARAGEARQGTLRYQIANLIGQPEYTTPSNEPELQRLLAGLQQKKAADLQKEQYRTTALEVLKPALEDPEFGKELAYFEAQNAKIRQAAATDFLPDIYETREQVVVRLAPQVAKLYDEYLTKKAKKAALPQLPPPARVL